MESYCNNHNSMNCPRGATMCNRDGLCVNHSQTVNHCDRMSHCHRRETNVERCQREGCAEQRRGGTCVEQCKRVDSCKKEECTRPCVKETRVTNCQNREEVKNRSVEVECVCKVSSAAQCHRHDEMEHLGCEFPVVMAYVPWQQWGDLYDVDCGLKQGTIFKDLNLIFCGERC